MPFTKKISRAAKEQKLRQGAYKSLSLDLPASDDSDSDSSEALFILPAKTGIPGRSPQKQKDPTETEIPAPAFPREDPGAPIVRQPRKSRWRRRCCCLCTFLLLSFVLFTVGMLTMIHLTNSPCKDWKSCVKLVNDIVKWHGPPPMESWDQRFSGLLTSNVEVFRLSNATTSERNILIFATTSHLRALDISHGLPKELWTSQIERNCSVTKIRCHANGCVVGGEGTLKKIDPLTGERLWTKESWFPNKGSYIVLWEDMLLPKESQKVPEHVLIIHHCPRCSKDEPRTVQIFVLHESDGSVNGTSLELPESLEVLNVQWKPINDLVISYRHKPHRSLNDEKEVTQTSLMVSQWSLIAAAQYLQAADMSPQPPPEKSFLWLSAINRTLIWSETEDPFAPQMLQMVDEHQKVVWSSVLKMGRHIVDAVEVVNDTDVIAAFVLRSPMLRGRSLPGVPGLRVKRDLNGYPPNYYGSLADDSSVYAMAPYPYPPLNQEELSQQLPLGEFGFRQGRDPIEPYRAVDLVPKIEQELLQRKAKLDPKDVGGGGNEQVVVEGSTKKDSRREESVEGDSASEDSSVNREVLKSINQESGKKELEKEESSGNEGLANAESENKEKITTKYSEEVLETEKTVESSAAPRSQGEEKDHAAKENEATTEFVSEVKMRQKMKYFDEVTLVKLPGKLDSYDLHGFSFWRKQIVDSDRLFGMGRKGSRTHDTPVAITIHKTGDQQRHPKEVSSGDQQQHPKEVSSGDQQQRPKQANAAAS
ncbi:unnamed protein product [Cyprideis torosa]|uniref:Uncharacterized protein n=1 Tax=Cyprideis torosa TaxID=163714 RepID=A0A7R8WAC8_9CRUS|nr:unnamed protein product [Cyprideis torosa]CAG0890841.1 unnamed protein product [Cyprideis torosa]